MLAAIWAQDEQGTIGKEGKLPWSLPNDLKFFKKMTLNHTIVMGRKTFEGMGKRLLPERQTIILTSDPNYQIAGALVMHSVTEILDYAKGRDEVIFITGGSAVFQEFIPYLDVLYRTLIHETFAGDTFFPEIDWENWSLISVSEGVTDEKNRYAHQFETYQKKC